MMKQTLYFLLLFGLFLIPTITKAAPVILVLCSDAVVCPSDGKDFLIPPTKEAQVDVYLVLDKPDTNCSAEVTVDIYGKNTLAQPWHFIITLGYEADETSYAEDAPRFRYYLATNPLLTTACDPFEVEAKVQR